MREGGLQIGSANADPASVTFGRLIDAHLNSAYRLASALLGSAPDAEDAVQDAAAIAWASFHRLREPTSFDGWFDRILVNKCRDRLRRRGRIKFIDIADAPEPATADRSARFVERDALARALDGLPPAQRVVVVLRYLEDRSVEEIAALTGERSGTVKSRLHYGLLALRAAYDAAARGQEVF
jgi:RNA polymerase sigma factor (sigma-70 family)